MHQTPRPDRTRPPNPYPRQNRHIGPNPAILLNNNIPTQRRALRALPAPWINRVRTTNQLHIRAENAPRTDLHGASIRNAAIRANEDVIADFDIVPVFAGEGRLDDAILAAGARGGRHVGGGGRFAVGAGGVGGRAESEDLAEEADALAGADAVGGVRGVVEAPDCCYALFAVLDEDRGRGVVVQAAEHFLAFGHLLGLALVG